jgi:chemotaxis protein MotB
MFRKTQDDEALPGAPDWLVTYGDMMSLLLTFFIMLVSMSEIKEEQRFQAIMESLRKRFGHESAVLSMMPGPTLPQNAPIAKMATMGRARRANTMTGGDKVRAPVGDHARVQAPRPADNPTLGGVVFFSEDDAELSPENRGILKAVAREVEGKPQRIEIRGHTSTRPLPPDSPFHNHWDLAYARCVVTMEYLVELGIPPKRFRLGVAADNEPRHTGHDPLLWRENPRVEVFLLDELAEEFKAGPPGTAVPDGTPAAAESSIPAASAP